MYWLQFQTRIGKDVTEERENAENVKKTILEAMVKSSVSVKSFLLRERGDPNPSSEGN